MIIDITNEVFTKLSDSLSGVTVRSAYPKTIPSFPCVIFSEISNDSVAGSRDSSGEHFNSISFEVNIFTNSQDKMSEAKSIRNRVDAILSDYYGMSRDTSSPVPNYADTDIYRYVMRYSCIIDQNKTIYGI